MTNRKLSRKMTVQSEDAVHWRRPFSYAFFAYLVLYFCAVLAAQSAAPVVRTILGLALLLGLAGFVAVGIVLGVRSAQRFRLVFTTHWIEPKRVRRVLTRLEYRKRGVAACVWPIVRQGLLISCLLTAIWLLKWGTSEVDSSARVIGLPWALLFVLVAGITFAAVPHVIDLLDVLLSSKTIGFDSQWMGFLRGYPGKALWRYEQVASVRFESMQTGKRERRLMVVMPREGHEMAFGLSDEVDVCEIADFLADKGVEVSKV